MELLIGRGTNKQIDLVKFPLSSSSSIPCLDCNDFTGVSVTASSFQCFYLVFGPFGKYQKEMQKVAFPMPSPQALFRIRGGKMALTYDWFVIEVKVESYLALKISMI